MTVGSTAIDSVSITNVSFVHFNLTVDLSALSLISPITVKISDSAMTSNSSLTIRGSSASAYPSVTIVLSGINATSGSFTVSGTFPNNTYFSMSNCTFAQGNITVSLSSVVLQNNSTMTFSDSFFADIVPGHNIMSAQCTLPR